ncbi:hypothetical protein K438DRAFT_1961161 [Mycena galopus ATCC 62051]|nr:hypothetical protein K438DRAFT_1961161 [Mycena galopus ATCC 62051]
MVFSFNWGYVGLDWLGPVGGWRHGAKPLFHSAKFDHGPLEAAIDSVVEMYGLNKEDKQMKGQALLAQSGAAKMLLCTTAQNRAETVLFHSYPHDVSHTLSFANNRMKWHDLVFWDSALLNNNPINELWDACYNLVALHDPTPCVSCIISLGCDYVKPGSLLASWFQLLLTVGNVIGFATNTEAKGKDFSQHVSNLKWRKE